MADEITPNLLTPLELAIQQKAIERQRKMADLLQEGSLQAPQGQMVGGYYVKSSPLQYLGKLAEGLAGMKRQGDLDRKEVTLGKQQAAAALEEARKLKYGDTAPQPITGDISSVPNTTPVSAGNAGNAAMPATGTATPSNMPAIAQVLQGKPIPSAQQENPLYKGIPLTDIQAFRMGGDKTPGGQVTKMLMENNLKAMLPTDKQKEWEALAQKLGVPVDVVMQNVFAEMRKNGTLTLTPGQPYQTPDGQWHASPDFKEGTQGVLAPDGTAMGMREIPNAADIAAKRAGGIKEAEELAKLRTAPPTAIKTERGTYLVTPARQKELADAEVGGTAPLQPGNFSEPTGLDLSKLTPKQMQLITDPVALKNGVARMQQTSGAQGSSTPQNSVTAPQGNGLGIKLKDDTLAEGDVDAIKKGNTTIYEQYDKLKTAPQTIMNLERAKTLIPKSITGGFANEKLVIAKFVNDNLGLKIDPDKITSTEELSSELSKQIIGLAKQIDPNMSAKQEENLRKMVGTISNDPNALPRILSATQDALSEGLRRHKGMVDNAKKNGLRFTIDPTIEIPNYVSQLAPQSALGGNNVDQQAILKEIQAELAARKAARGGQ